MTDRLAAEMTDAAVQSRVQAIAGQRIAGMRETVIVETTLETDATIVQGMSAATTGMIDGTIEETIVPSIAEMIAGMTAAKNARTTVAMTVTAETRSVMTAGRTIVVVTAPVVQARSSQPVPAAEVVQAATVATSAERIAVRTVETMISVAMIDQATGTAGTTAVMTDGQPIAETVIAETIEETITDVMAIDEATDGMETEGTVVGVTDETIDGMAIVEAMTAAAVVAETEIATGKVEIEGTTRVEVVIAGTAEMAAVLQLAPSLQVARTKATRRLTKRTRRALTCRLATMVQRRTRPRNRRRRRRRRLLKPRP